MIKGIKNAILHILDANSGVTVYSDTLIDSEDETAESYIASHIEKVYDDPSLRPGEFNKSSGFLYHMNEYINGDTDFRSMSVHMAERLYEGISTSDKIESCDVLICDCTMDEDRVLAVLKCDNKVGYIHRVVQEEGTVKNEIINHYAILPSMSQRVSQCAFVNMDTKEIKFKGKKVSIDGESVDLISDVLLECIFDFSTKESFNAVNKIAKKVSEDNGVDMIETEAKIKQYVKDTAIVDEIIDVNKVADVVFANSINARSEFKEKTAEAQIPEKIEMNEYVTKRVNKNIKIVTDTGIEISFPAEYYKDDENFFIINNDDGTLSIRIDNIGEIINK